MDDHHCEQSRLIIRLMSELMLVIPCITMHPKCKCQSQQHIESKSDSKRGFFTVADCIAQLESAKASANRRQVYIKSLSQYLGRFADGCGNCAIQNVTTEHVEKWISQFQNASTRQTWLNRINTLFSHCVRRGIIQTNPCDRIERISIDRAAPQILTPSQAQLLLKSTPQALKPYLALAMFAGIRPDGELMKMEWVDIDFKTGTVRVQHPKTRKHRRIVKLEPVAIRILQSHPDKYGRIAPSASTVRRWKRSARVMLGFASWPKDILRHTAASYLMALHKDAGKVATQLGNSTHILLTHYHEPVTQEDCAAFWDS